MRTLLGVCLAWMVLAAVLPAARAQSDTLWVNARVEPAVVKLGQPLNVTVSVPAAWGDSLVGPPAPATLGPLDLLASERASRPDSLSWIMRVSFFDLGDLTLPPLLLTLYGEGEPGVVATKPFRVTVVPTAPDTAQVLRAAKPPVPTPLRWEWFMILGALMAVALVIWGLWFLRRNRLDPEPWIDRTPPEPPHQVALKALRELEEEALPARGLMREHYYRLSAILRLYMERRFQFPAAEETTFEIAPHLERLTGLSDEDRREALDILDRADLAKFAKFNPGADPANSDLSAVRLWVERTTPNAVRGSA